MSYAEYWEGSADLTRYYREAFRIKQKRQTRIDDFNNWSLGRYIHEAVGAIFCSTKNNPVRYPSLPYTEQLARQERLTQEEKEEAQREAELKFHKELMRRYGKKNTAES